MSFIMSLAVLASLVFPNHAEMANLVIMEARRENLPVVPVMLVVWKESRFDPKAFNPRDIDGKQKFGLLQYDTDTWNHFRKKMDMPELDIKDWRHQIRVFSYAVKNGESWRWPSVKSSLKETEKMNIEGI